MQLIPPPLVYCPEKRVTAWPILIAQISDLHIKPRLFRLGLRRGRCPQPGVAAAN
jgi:hypothetical protein